MPFEMPNTMTPNVSASASTCQPTLPKSTASPPKYVAVSVTAMTSPVMLANRYFSSQPTTTEYPMASASAPSMGMAPRILPARRPFSPKRMTMAFENAPTEPSCAMRPNAISLATPVKPSTTMNTMNGIRNAAPPNSAMRYGNSQMQPMPTADPTHEMMNAALLVKLSRPAAAPFPDASCAMPWPSAATGAFFSSVIYSPAK